MKSVLVLMISSFAIYSKALKCGISSVSNEHFTQIITECVKENNTLNSILDLVSGISIEDDSSVGSDEQVPVTRGLVNNLNTKKVASTKSGRTKRSRKSKSFNNDSPMSNVQKTSTTTEEAPTTEGQSNEDTNINNVADSEDFCVLQCIFEKLELTESDGHPDHKKFAAALLKTATRREIRDFLQESTDECFQQIEQENSEGPCEYASKLVLCMAEKGKTNCEDWPTGNLPF